jgi:hypothetical protein
MTKIGMALDPARQVAIARRRSRRRVLAEVLVATVAIAELVGAGVVLTQRSVSTQVAVQDLLSDFRTSQLPLANSGVVPSEASRAQTPSDEGMAPAVSDAAPGSSDQSPYTQPSDAADAPVAQAPTSEMAEGTSVASAPVFGLPSEGLYTYDTTGYERISLGGSRHDYPEQTHVLVSHTGGCEWTFDHRVLEEKRTVSTYCHDGPAQLAVAYDGWITFYGSTAESHYTCDRGIRGRLGDSPGDTHRSSCTDGDGTSSDITTFVAMQVMDVGGVRVEALHYQIDTTLSGSVVGTSKQQIWLHPDSGLPLRIERRTDTEANEFGAQVNYVEDATFKVVSLTPER